MKLHPYAFACGTALAAAAATILMLRTPSSRRPVQEMRAIASPHTRTSQDPCLNLKQVICAQTAVTRDSTGTVRPDVEGEQMAIDLLGKISAEHPEYTQDQLDEALAHAIYTPKNIARLESTFRWVRHSMEKFIDSQPETNFTPREKKQLKHRLRQIELQLPPPVSVYADEPDLITKNDVFYERLTDGKMRLRVGGAYFFSVGSSFNMIFTLAHELAHSIDPCEVRSARLSFPAYDRLTACFMQQKLVATRKNRLECGQKDQLSETFADWMAVHVTARALRNYSTEFHGKLLVNAMINSVRDLCESEDVQMDHDVHPSAIVRLDRIFGRNPEIREVLGCEAQPAADPTPYCDFDFKIERPAR